MKEGKGKEEVKNCIERREKREKCHPSHSLPLFVPVLLDVEAPCPFQVDVLVIVDKAGLHLILAA